MFRLPKLIAIFYSAVFLGVDLWTWDIFFVYLGSTKEHMVPALVLTLISMPSSLIIELLAVWFPALLDNTLLLISITSLCGLFQVVLVWFIAILLLKRNKIRQR